MSTIPEITFKDLVVVVGPSLVRQVLAKAAEEWETSGGGITCPFEELQATLTILDDKDVNFRLGEWGPYKLPIERVRAILAAVESGD